MRTIMKSCFNQKDREYLENLIYLKNAHDEHKSLGIPLLGNDLYLNFLDYMKKTYDNSRQFPSENLFLINFPDLPKDTFTNVQVIPLEDFHVYVNNYINNRLNKTISNRIKELLNEIADDGLTQEIADQLEGFKKLSNKNKTPDISLRQYSRDNYDERLKRPMGMITGIEKLDNLIGGMDEGTVSVIAGYTSHMKTMFAINAAYLNSYYNGYNIAYFSLETPKDMMYDQLLSRHSHDSNFPKYQFIPHEKIRKCTLSQDEQDYLFNEIEPDLYTDYTDREGNKCKRGRVVFFDLSDFETFSFTEISNTLEALDDKLGGNLDAVIVDYAQLCKFVEGGTYLGDDNRIINYYVAYFRKIAQGFRSGKKKKKLIVILLSQINRESWKKAAKKDGYYDLTCLADANELERGASRVFTTYTSENMKIVKEAQVQLLKNRNGATMWEPEKVFADPEAYVYGDDFDSFGQALGGNISQNSLADALSVLDSDDLF